jgi:hypothetical protein
MQIIDKGIQKQVMALISKDDKQYNQFVYDCGLAYLNELAPQYPQVTTEITRSETFWDWWKGHWAVREMEFLEIIDESPAEAIIDVMQVYNDLHDPKVLAEALYLNGQVLQQSYANLIGKITKEQTHETAIA